MSNLLLMTMEFAKLPSVLGTKKSKANLFLLACLLFCIFKCKFLQINSFFEIYSLTINFIYYLIMYGTDTSSSGNIDPLNALSFFRTVGKLKLLKRTGWVNHGIFNVNVTSVFEIFFSYIQYFDRDSFTRIGS